MNAAVQQLHPENEVFHAGTLRPVLIERNDIPESVCLEPPDLSLVFLILVSKKGEFNSELCNQNGILF